MNRYLVTLNFGDKRLRVFVTAASVFEASAKAQLWDRFSIAPDSITVQFISEVL